MSLYVVTAPLAKLGLDRVSALEITTVFFDVLISALLAFLAWRFLDDRRAGLLAAAIYAFVPMNLLSLSAGNFTNLFAVSMLALVFAFLVVASADGERRAAALLAVTILAALTAYFGLLLEAALLFPLWLVALWLLPVPVKDERRFVSLAVLAAFVVAGVYYLGYWDLFTSQWERALDRDSAAAAFSGPKDKLSFNLELMGEQLGWVFLLTALLGAVGLGRGFGASLFHTLAAIWFAVTLLFFGIDLFSALRDPIPAPGSADPGALFGSLPFEGARSGSAQPNSRVGGDDLPRRPRRSRTPRGRTLSLSLVTEFVKL